MPQTRARRQRLIDTYQPPNEDRDRYQRDATEGADEVDFTEWKNKNNDWIKPGGDDKGRKTGLVYVVRPKPGQENFIKVGSTNEVWDRFKSRYREYLPAGFEIYAIAQYAGMTVDEEKHLRFTTARKLDPTGRLTESELANKFDQQAKVASFNKAHDAETAIHANLRETIGEGQYYDKARRKWQGVRVHNHPGEWFDVKDNGKPSSGEGPPKNVRSGYHEFDNPNKNNMEGAPDKIFAKKDNYIPFSLDMVKQQGRHDDMKTAQSGGQKRYFNGYDIKQGNTLAKTYQTMAGMLRGGKREAWEVFSDKEWEDAVEMPKRLRGKSVKKAIDRFAP